ncbi:MAG: hypothetical protein TEF_16690 [Rhizobiales bacterium NRL2]|jgi:toxin ParE1/3/4|nr:MAG: hypothetical protein TEF_16690 [Rhizobiales bacterium NRL2]
MAGFDLTVEAEGDLREIWLYTAENWGPDQADRYLGDLEDCCAGLAGRPVRIWSEIHARLKSTRCRRHVIFFLDPTGGRPIVLGFLHERMDLLARLQDRI